MVGSCPATLAISSASLLLERFLELVAYPPRRAMRDNAGFLILVGDGVHRLHRRGRHRPPPSCQPRPADWHDRGGGSHEIPHEMVPLRRADRFEVLACKALVLNFLSGLTRCWRRACFAFRSFVEPTCPGSGGQRGMFSTSLPLG